MALFAFQLAFNVIASPLAVIAYHVLPFPVSLVLFSVSFPVEVLYAELFDVSVEFKLNPTTFGVFAGGVIDGIWGIALSLPVAIIIIATIKFFRKDINETIDSIKESRE